MRPKWLASLTALLTTFALLSPPLVAQYDSGSQAQYPPYQQAPAPNYPSQPNYPAQNQNAPYQYPPQNPSQYPSNLQYPPVQGQQPPNDAASDAQHGVARISIVQGDVNVKRGDSGELVAASINAPLTVQDHLQTSQGSRAEVELDYGNLVRLAPNTDVSFADLEYHRYQLQLGAGSVIYRVLRNSGAQAEIDTPSIAAKPTGEGEYRISVLPDGTTQLTVRAGQLEVYSPRGSEMLGPGRTMLVRGDPNDPEFQTAFELARDEFDDWSEHRDQQLLASKSYNYVSPDVYGADDLDAYGNWVPSQYGTVWEPQPPVPGWAPYSYGHWVWEGYYGWTWVDYAPWGWAPFHYGRWFWNGGRGWCWWPGAIAAHFLWSPALVGFFGLGGLGFGGFGGLGWIALAPFELFHAWWGRGFSGWHGGYYGGFNRYNVNIVRNANVYNVYRNARINGAAITTQYNRFGTGAGQFGRASTAQLRNASLFHGQVPISPSRQSYQFGNRSATPNPRLTSAANRQFFTSRGFSRQTPNYTQGRNFANRAPSAPTQHGVAPNMRSGFANSAGRSPSDPGGWHRFGVPNAPGNSRQGFANSPDAGGWHRFGVPNAPGNSNRQGFYSARPSSPGNYQSRPLYTSPGSRGFSGYGNGYSRQSPSFSAPRSSAPNSYRYSLPSAPHYSAPRYSAPHYSAPSASHYHAPSSSGHSGGGSFHGGGGSHGGGSHGGGGGGHHGR